MGDICQRPSSSTQYGIYKNIPIRSALPLYEFINYTLPFSMPSCPYYNCDNPFHWGPVIGPIYPKKYRARWRHLKKPCCDWCRIWKDIAKSFVGAATSYATLSLTNNFSFNNYGFLVEINFLGILATNSTSFTKNTNDIL